ncbi:MAG: hypothetical protein U0984_09075 [Prosthecobacter sp.]|nr:hypothetical protein [Prosthecobacter sp.]
MRTILRFLLIAVVVIGLLGSLGFGAVSWYVMRKLGPDFWVALIENDTNCRAHVDSARISLFTQPATLKLTGVRIAPRDAEMAKPFVDRLPLTDSASAIVIPQVALEVKLEDLLNRRLQIQHLHILQPVVKETQDAQGHSSLERLFTPNAPAVAALPPPVPPPGLQQPYPNVPKAVPIGQAAPAYAGPEPPAQEPSTEDPSAFTVAVESANIEQGHFTIVSRETTVNILNLDVTVTGIDSHPVLTDRQIPTQITLAGEINVNGLARIGGVKRPAELAHLLLSGAGDVIPIDPRTGAWNPTTRLRLTLAKGSVLGGHVTMGDSAGKEMRKLQEYGIDLTPVPIGGPLLQDTVVEGIFANNQFTLGVITRFVFPEYELVIEPNSWINSSKDQHLMRLHLSCGAALQQRLQNGIAQAKLGDSIARAITQALSDERGRMTFDIVSSGALSNPEVKPSIDRILNNLLRGQGLGDLLQGLLKKIK